MVMIYVSIVELECALTYYDFFLLFFAFFGVEFDPTNNGFCCQKLDFLLDYLTTFVDTAISCLYPRIYKA